MTPPSSALTATLQTLIIAPAFIAQLAEAALGHIQALIAQLEVMRDFPEGVQFEDVRTQPHTTVLDCSQSDNDNITLLVGRKSGC